MFWSSARSAYAGITADDPDIRRYLEISSEFQQTGNDGVVGKIHDIGHRWIAARSSTGRTLEIGFGAGRQRRFFKGRAKDYYPSEYSPWHFSSEAWRSVSGRGTAADARNLPYRDGVFENVVSIYNLEHIDDLGAVLAEVRRVLRTGGRFLVALPCEGGLMWNVGRELTTRRAFTKRYGINYDKAIAFEHVHDFREVVEAIRNSKEFTIQRLRLFPFAIPTHHLNLIACLDCIAS